MTEILTNEQFNNKILDLIKELDYKVTYSRSRKVIDLRFKSNNNLLSEEFSIQANSSYDDFLKQAEDKFSLHAQGPFNSKQYNYDCSIIYSISWKYFEQINLDGTDNKMYYAKRQDLLNALTQETVNANIEKIKSRFIKAKFDKFMVKLIEKKTAWDEEDRINNFQKCKNELEEELMRVFRQVRTNNDIGIKDFENFIDNAFKTVKIKLLL